MADTAQFARSFDPDQWSNGFAIMARTPAAEGLTPSTELYQWGYGTEPPSDVAGVIEPGIRQLFNGIHLAGPDLTPVPFRDGLLRYPVSGGGPSRPSNAYGDWADLDNWPGGDVALAWWDREAEGTDAAGNEGEPYGRIGSSWRIDGGQLVVDVTVPPGTSAAVVLPHGDRQTAGPGTHRMTGLVDA